MEVFPPNFLVRKLCLNGHVLQIFGGFARKFAATIYLQKISSPENQVKNLVFYLVILSNFGLMFFSLKCTKQ